MASCLYVASWNLNGSDGITKKIKSQMSSLDEMSTIFHCCIFNSNEEDNLLNYYDYIYVRNCNGKDTLKIIRLLLRVKAKKIFYEIPTYPYYGEITSFSSKLEYLFKKIVIRFFATKIVYIGHHNKDSIWGVPAYELTNAISEPYIPWELSSPKDNKTYNIIGVASQAPWHGYDRLIKSFRNYKNINMIFHIVGDGPSLILLKSLVKELCINDKVIFHGRLYGNDLYELMARMDCGIDSLARHRVGVTYNSSLKAKEYLAFGLPVIMSHIDKSIINNEFVMKVDSSEDALDLDDLRQFIHCFKGSKKKIQKYAYSNFTWKSQFNILLKGK